jgi:hypothetical protein
MPRKGKVIAGITKIGDFPFDPVLAIKFSYILDYMVVGFMEPCRYGEGCKVDYTKGKEWYELFKKVHPFPDTVKVDMFVTDDSTYILEQLVRRLDHVKPDIVLECEADASFDYDNGFFNELDEFIESGADSWYMKAENVTVDDDRMPPLTLCEHQRAAKWWSGLTYDFDNYPGFCVTLYEGYPDRERKVYRGKTKLLHFPLFNEKLREEKQKTIGDLSLWQMA